MIVDFDDFCEHENRLDLLETLKAANPLFRCTMFAIPALGSRRFWDRVPEWIELAVHGWSHPHPREAESWTFEKANAVMTSAQDAGPFVNGFKAPGWQISKGTYRAIRTRGWWVADHYDNNGRRPEGIKAHVISTSAAHGADPDHWHGHIPNVCGNGIEETFGQLLEVVTAARSFEFVSEAVSPWRLQVAA